jgi:hypothetical protein
VSATHGALRLCRSAVLGATCLTLSLSAHVAAGGAAPSLAALAVLAVPIACVSVLLTGSRAGLPRIAVMLAATQLGLHQALMALADHPCAGAVGPLGDPMAGHGGAAAAACAGSGMSSTVTMSAPSTPMVAAHVAAASIMGLALWYGDQLLWALLSRLGVRAIIRPTLTLSPAGAAAATTAVRRVASLQEALGGVGRRGPPAAALA